MNMLVKLCDFITYFKCGKKDGKKDGNDPNEIDITSW